MSGSTNNSHETSQEKMKCYNHGVHCTNNAVAEFDLADGKGVQFYCRKCIEEFSSFEEDDPESYIVDDSLIFCNREWNEQK